MEKRVILLPLDGSKGSEQSFNWYMNSFRRSGDEVRLVNVPETPLLPNSLCMGAVIIPEDWKHGVKTSLDKSQETLEGYKKRCEEAGVNCSVNVASGEQGTGQAICDVAKSTGANNIIMGSRGIGLLRKTFLGSVSSYVLSHSDVPVTVTPPPKE